ncbi:MAG: DUF58 domain-containing protein [Sandaracinaceae bacterium]
MTSRPQRADKARALVARGRRVARRVADWFPLTPLGLLVLGGAGAALQYIAYPSLDLVWLVVGFAAVGLVVTALLAVVIGTVWAKLATRGAPHPDVERRVMETGRSLPTGFVAPSLHFLPLVQLRWTWESPEGAEVTRERRGLRIRERVRLQQRGKVTGIRRRLEVRDAFGLASLAIRADDPEELTVLPHVGRLAETPLLISFAGGDDRPHPMGLDDGDRVELRRYVAGDPARFIHWKVFGRTGKLMVRVPERALSPARRTALYMVAGEGDEASAAAARVAVEAELFGAEWTFSADGADGDADRADAALEMIVRSKNASSGGAGFEGFLQRAERGGPASVIVFVPPRPGPWIARVLATTARRAARTRFVIATDGVDRSPPLPRWRRWLAFVSAPKGTPARDLDAVRKALAGSRAEVVVIDRVGGRRLGKRAQEAMRALERAA